MTKYNSNNWRINLNCRNKHLVQGRQVICICISLGTHSHEFETVKLTETHSKHLYFNSNYNHCLFRELPSASPRVRHTRVAAEGQDEFKGAVNRWLLPWVVFSSVLRVACACMAAKATYEHLYFSNFVLSCCFY